MSYVTRVLERLSSSELETWADILAGCEHGALGPASDPLTLEAVRAQIHVRANAALERTERLDA